MPARTRRAAYCNRKKDAGSKTQLSWSRNPASVATATSATTTVTPSRPAEAIRLTDESELAAHDEHRRDRPVRDPFRDRAECAQAVKAPVADDQQVARRRGID
jgi:hypothetical protein